MLGLVVASTMTLGLVGIAASASGASQKPHVTCAPGATSAACTLNVAWPPLSDATSIFPFYNGANFSVASISDLQALLYRPLFWYGSNTGGIAEVPALSPGTISSVSNAGGHTSATITLKGWKFTNWDGTTEPVDARSVVFFLNMYKAEASNFGDYTPGYGIPDQVTNVVVNNANSLTIDFNSVISTKWLEENELSQIIPMPQAWDTTGCGTDAWTSSSLQSDCSTDWTNMAVNLNGNGCVPNPSATPPVTCTADFSSYNDPHSLWQWVDGPWRLKSFGISGGAPSGVNVLVPNTGYSGPVKAKLGQVVFHPETSEGAEVQQLKSSSLDLGYAEEADVTKAPKPGEAGTNLSSSHIPSLYKVVGGQEFGFSYAYVNFGTSTSTHPLPAGNLRSELNMTYIRQAMLDGEDQPKIVANIYHNYGVTADLGPVPVLPANNYGAGVKWPYPYSITNGKNLLKKNGFVNGVCTKTNCGTAAYPISKNAKINFTYIYSSGDPAFQAQLEAEQAAWKSEGIHVTLDGESSESVIGDCFAGGKAWEFCQYGGWIYYPDFYPTFESLWHTGSGANFGGYTNTEMNALIDGTTKSGNYNLNQVQPTYHTSALAFALLAVPYLYQPTELGPGEVSKDLSGVPAPSPLAVFMPEYISKS